MYDWGSYLTPPLFVMYCNVFSVVLVCSVYHAMRHTTYIGLPKMGDEVVVVDSESTARAIVAQRKKQLEVQELEKQVCYPLVPWHPGIHYSLGNYLLLWEGEPLGVELGIGLHREQF